MNNIDFVSISVFSLIFFQNKIYSKVWPSKKKIARRTTGSKDCYSLQNLKKHRKTENLYSSCNDTLQKY